jgi:Plant transposon protein
MIVGKAAEYWWHDHVEGNDGYTGCRIRPWSHCKRPPALGVKRPNLDGRRPGKCTRPGNWHIVERLFPNTCSFWLDGRSKHTPEQARTRTCHVVPYSPNGKPQMCLATDCNAWRWKRHPLNWRGMFTRRRGRCATSDLRSLRSA